MNQDDDGTSSTGEPSHRTTAARPTAQIVSVRNTPSYASYARSIIEVRKRLPQFIPTALFSDPAFDMMLDLFVASEEDDSGTLTRCVSVARAPYSTAVRYISALIKENLIEVVSTNRTGTPDRLRLTPAAHEGMKGWLASTSPIPLRRGD